MMNAVSCSPPGYEYSTAKGVEYSHRENQSFTVPPINQHPAYKSQSQIQTHQGHEYTGAKPTLNPCVIPQITKPFGTPYNSPFARAHAPDLSTRLPADALLSFIDALNESFLPNAVLKTKCTEGSSMAGVSIVRTKAHLKQANESVFGPRGLNVRLCKTVKMLESIGMGGEERVFGGIDGTEDSLTARIEVLGDRVMGLRFDATSAGAVERDNWMKKFRKQQAQKAEKKQLDKLKKTQQKNRGKINEVDREIATLTQQKEDILATMQGIGQSQQQDQDELQKELDKLDKKLHREEKKLDKISGGISQMKEAKKMERIFWLVITEGDGDGDGECDFSDNESA